MKPFLFWKGFFDLSHESTIEKNEVISSNSRFIEAWNF